MTFLKCSSLQISHINEKAFHVNLCFFASKEEKYFYTVLLLIVLFPQQNQNALMVKMKIGGGILNSSSQECIA